MHIMIDLETLGTKPSAPIMQIGLAAFQLLPITEGNIPDGAAALITASTTINIAVQDHIIRGRVKVDEETVKWWKRQDPRAIDSLTNPPAVGIHLAGGLLREFVKLYAPDEEGRRVWYNGAVFDGGLLEILAEQLGEELPWRYNAPRDMRTVKDLARDLAGWEAPARTVLHSGEDDARAQVVELISAYTALHERCTEMRLPAPGPLPVVPHW